MNGPSSLRTDSVARSAGRSVQMRRAALWLLWSIGGSFTALLVWAALAEVDVVTRAEGRVIPSARLQVIQNLEGGIVTDIAARQGQSVEAGASLVELSRVQHEAEQQTRMQQVLALQARLARLQAEAVDAAPLFPQAVRRDAPEVARSEAAAFESRRAERRAQLAVLDAQIEQKQREVQEARVGLEAAQRSWGLAKEERDTVARLVERGLEPRLELVRSERALGELQGRLEVAPVTLQRLQSALAEMRARREATLGQFRAEALAQLNLAQAELNALQQVIPALADKVARTAIRAPMKGVVNRIFVNTVGGVVRPGDPILEIVPADDQLVVEALVQPRDIGFTKIGQTANVKITAFDYAIFGSMQGRVASISADAVPNERGEAYYLVRVETSTTAIEALDKKLAIIPGMQAQVDIVTGKRTVLQFLTKPLVALKENAFRER